MSFEGLVTEWDVLSSSFDRFDVTVECHEHVGVSFEGPFKDPELHSRWFLWLLETGDGAGVDVIAVRGDGVLVSLDGDPVRVRPTLPTPRVRAS